MIWWIVLSCCPHRLAEICETIAQEGCNFSGVTKGKWKLAKQFLKERKFPEWGLKRETLIPSLSDIWRQLWEMAAPSTQLLIEALEIPYPQFGFHLGISWEDEEDDSDCLRVPVGSKIRYQINAEEGGYLILLDRFPEEDVFCLSPSFLTGMWKIPTGEFSIPSAFSKREYLKVKPPTGQEELLAAIVPKRPEIEWLNGREEQKPLQLEARHLQELLGELKGNDKAKVMRLRYWVTAN
jgi:hypothetical protein